ncbi:MAG: MBL fold metallo-hydrolase [Candidatus Sulfopaludibacter sp.]|nr:MBL fold metallo-hydrolase [Candidatus Sulfopaludibacter sp.]
MFPAHYNGRRFFNPGGSGPRGFLSVLKWMLTRRREPSPEFIPVEPSAPPHSVDSPSLLVTLVNHSTVLLQQPGCHILTDPIWSERCSPFSFIGPRRHRLPGVEFDRLPTIHTVLLSHNHYDHLDLSTLRRLSARGGAIFVVPLGLAPFLESHGITPVRQLDWGESLAVSGATIHAVPAFHFSGRGAFDRDKTLWCGYMIESAFGKVYFAADTGFGPHFGWIRDRFGAPRAALLPIGAYEPGWFMSPVHMNPEEALAAHRILGAQTSIAIHHGTFQLADESVDAPGRRLRACGAPESFLILDNGGHALLT